MRILSIVSFLSLAALSLGCGSAGKPGDATKTDVKSTIERAAQSTSDFTHEQKEAFSKQMEEKLGLLNKQMEALEKKGQNLPADAKSRWEKTMAQLKEQKESLKNLLQKAGDTSVDQWGKFSKDAAKAYQQLENGLKKAMQEFHGSDSSGQKQ